MSDIQFTVVKNTAYLIDKAIFFNEHEIDKAYNHTPSFSDGKNPYGYSALTKDNVKLISKMFRGENYRYDARKSYLGVGISKNADGYGIVLYGDKTSNLTIGPKLKFIENLLNPKFRVNLEIVDFLEIAANGRCEGGEGIISPCGNKRGQLGGWFARCKTQDEKRCFVGITNAHVVTDVNSHVSPIGKKIRTQHGIEVAEIEHVIPLKPYRNRPLDHNYVDLALLRPLDNSLVSTKINPIATVPLGDRDAYTMFSINPQETLQICQGGICHDCIINELLLNFYFPINGTIYKFSELFKISVGNSGWSGALVFDKRPNVVGLFFAYGKEKNGQMFGLAAKWKRVRDEMNSVGIDITYQESC